MNRAKINEWTQLMDNAAENSLRERQMYSQGKLLSSFSHDLKNHLAIIIESKGLLHDYIEMGRIPDHELSDKIEKILKQLDERTEKITSMAHQLNSLSHRSDTSTSIFELNKFMHEQLFFLQRFARLKNISLKTNFTDSKIQLYNNPSLLQFLFQQLFEEALQHLQENDELEVTTKYKENEATLQLFLNSASNNCTPFDSLLNTSTFLLSLKKINARITIDLPSPTSQILTVILPG